MCISERDQGFTRAKVLILLPFQNSAYHVVTTLIDLCPSSQRTTVEKLKRFKEEFLGPKEDDQIDKPGLHSSSSNPAMFACSSSFSSTQLIGRKLSKATLMITFELESSSPESLSSYIRISILLIS